MRARRRRARGGGGGGVAAASAAAPSDGAPQQLVLGAAASDAVQQAFGLAASSVCLAHTIVGPSSLAGGGTLSAAALSIVSLHSWAHACQHEAGVWWQSIHSYDFASATV